jgi:hypothetical protein
MSTRSLSLGVVLALGMLVGVARAGAPTEKETELNARQAFAAARYDEAIELFARLYAETLNPIYLRNIGRCHQKKREPDKALDAFRDYLAKGKSVSSSERKEIQGYIKEMEQLRDQQSKEREAQAKQTLTPAPPAPTPLASAPPPPSAVWGPPAPPESGTTTINVNPTPNPTFAYGAPPPPPSGPDNPMLVSGAPTSPPPRSNEHPIYTRWWFWTAIGVVAAGAVAAALLIPGGVTKPTCTLASPGDCK